MGFMCSSAKCKQKDQKYAQDYGKCTKFRHSAEVAKRELD